MGACYRLSLLYRQMVKCGPAGMQACSLVGLGLGMRLELVLGIGLGSVLALAMVLELVQFTFCHTSSPQKPASPQTRIYP